MQDGEVIIEQQGTAGIIRLNRPRALNSLTLPMIRTITDALDGFAGDADVASVVMSGEGERGLCAGGDIRALHESARAGDGLAGAFWREEFRLNHQIAAYPKPYVALMDGITMGGGVGLSSHGRHRIVTERTRLAMPETGIGYVPDVGATWLLPRAPGEAGTWLGLTGLDIGAADAIHASLADLQIASSRLGAVIDALSVLPRAGSPSDVDAVLQALSEPAGESRLRQNASVIDRVFCFDSVEEILAALAGEEGDFAAETRRVLMTRSPTSLKLALALLRAGRRSASLAECLGRELGACLQMLDNPDFFEGIRAAVIDKDRNPKWSPASIEAVGAATVERFLKPAEPPLSL
ncbi:MULTISPECIES: enoyl-CoA hydratase/isomerase family protein [unclassified Rhizobium]|uniref:enoyl-CoA hydratase/isomerase family protein n=1 Tax=unclassified Rhizobium TaxID=2613769 RepID=UPI001A981664|nr:MULTISPECIES: enoyl-CoA hydratase/isomerase family protein [unclassified Rhizobium]MBX5159412.1 enoyl-CoA hydratase/isomerase family protein [Rhizobium sp. NZLR8]MBX5167674.1 enoyl-CoA hydratase/isomerase family protein [Rhizobium sp. NZLR4b]MBX5170832.1 enoyl-CoA hydratase/isomerase family protein [Rhizobium sp. NZLR1b]MBX5181610.1 enoyl-CoA hydratase/isomerase family protein [Rhizobium sp. NZLR5]MBX5188514.1 enoyl-CoA hydratase/isomerase family protein [Rhizobium sp. NZLR3b]